MADLSAAEGALERRVPAAAAAAGVAAETPAAAAAAAAAAGVAAASTPAVRHGDGEAVIVARDVHPPGPQVHDRLVHAAVPEPQLVGAQSERPAEDLAAQADAEHWHALGEHPAHGLDRIAS